MHDQQVQDRFVTLRAAGSTYARIMTELNVSKPTLIVWSRKHRFQIQNLKAIELEALHEKWLATTAVRVNAIGEQLQKVEAELARRDIATLSTARLFSRADALRRQIERETGLVQFADFENLQPHACLTFLQIARLLDIGFAFKRLACGLESTQPKIEPQPPADYTCEAALLKIYGESLPDEPFENQSG